VQTRAEKGSSGAISSRRCRRWPARSALALDLVLQQQPVDARLGIEGLEVERLEAGERLRVEFGEARVARRRAVEGKEARQRATVGLVALDALAHPGVLARGGRLRPGGAGAGAQEATQQGRDHGSRHGIPFHPGDSSGLGGRH
jgi:hypothetical protein